MRVPCCFLALTLSLGSFAKIPEENKSCPDGKKYCRATLRHIESGGIGYDNGYTTFELFLSSDLDQWKIIPFFDAKGHIFDDGKWAANAGIGLRTLWGNRAYGINTYYDYRNARHLNANQIGLGLETLGERCDFRINGYLPVGKKISSPYDAVFDTFSSHYMLVSQKYQSAMKGADVEFGIHFGKTESFDFYAATGPYYFIGEKAPAAWGGKARVVGIFKDLLSLEIRDSYDKTFRNKFQGQIALIFSLGPKSKVKQHGRSCQIANALNNRMLQPVDRQEIIVIDTPRKNVIAIDPATGLPYFFVFVNNTSSSNGTYESPYHSLAQAQNNSSPNDIIYVFPGDGTTTGMNSGIFLQANQKFWGSGVNHLIQTAQGTISIPLQSSSSPVITNTDVDTEGNAITLARNNAISGITISSALNDAIFGTDIQNLDVSSCTFENTSTFAIEASFSSNASISLTNNQFSNNVNGVFLTLNGTSNFVCSGNTFSDQTSVSSFPLEISAHSNILTANIKNNIFKDNTTGAIRTALDNMLNADINILNNTIINNGTGAAGVGLGSNVVVFLPDGSTTNNCSLTLEDNMFSENASNSVYLHTSGTFTTVKVTASKNTISNNGGSAFALATPADTLTLLATGNNITGCGDNGISVTSTTPSQTANITINNNIITDINNNQNAIAINHGTSNLYFTAENNTINRCTGSGILFYPSEFTNATVNILSNVISDCQNTDHNNAASGISLDNYVNLVSTLGNNTLSNNEDPGVGIGLFTPGNPVVCLTLTHNSSDTDPGYSLKNPGSGAFNLSPCNIEVVNTGIITTDGTVNPVTSCPDALPCSP